MFRTVTIITAAIGIAGLMATTAQADTLRSYATDFSSQNNKKPVVTTTRTTTVVKQQTTTPKVVRSTTTTTVKTGGRNNNVAGGGGPRRPNAACRWHNRRCASAALSISAEAAHSRQPHAAPCCGGTRVSGSPESGRPRLGPVIPLASAPRPRRRPPGALPPARSRGWTTPGAHRCP